MALEDAGNATAEKLDTPQKMIFERGGSVSGAVPTLTNPLTGESRPATKREIEVVGQQMAEVLRAQHEGREPNIVPPDDVPFEIVMRPLDDNGNPVPLDENDISVPQAPVVPPGAQQQQATPAELVHFDSTTLGQRQGRLLGLLSAVPDGPEKQEYKARVEEMETLEEYRELKREIDVARKNERERRNLPPEPPPPPEGVPPAPPAGPPGRRGPRHSAQYFKDTGATWRTFDNARFSDITPLSEQQINANPLHARLFGELQIAMDPRMARAIAERTALNEQVDLEKRKALTPLQRQFLLTAQYELSRIITRFEPVQKKTQQILTEVFSRRLDLMQSLTQVGINADSIGQSVEAFNEEMLFTAVRRRALGDKFLEAFRHYTDAMATGRGKKSEAKINKICKQLQIPRPQYETLVIPGDPIQTEENISKFMLQRESRFMEWITKTEDATGSRIPGSTRWQAKWRHTGVLKKGTDLDLGTTTFSYGAMRASATEKSWNDPASWVTADIHEARDVMAQFLVLTLEGNSSEFRRRLEQSAATSQPLAPPASRQGPENLAQARRNAENTEQNKLNDPTYLQSLFNRDKLQATVPDAAEPNGYRGWEAMTRQEREAYRDQWVPQEAKNIGEGLENRERGFWSLIGRALARAFLMDKKKQLTTD